ncbi:type II toxin-antitoxin system HipA family toxin [Pelobacter seleniigenes]|uniref:type II toxin-antitoxin system HipA family toxin n=1 Tax=Pelobacter seleniigenes TaxID=407188 RepID=UPI0004A6C20F|nr:type II toxin-antitoxin system HipA family toxin [Pelobacter seleniigenes]
MAALVVYLNREPVGWLMQVGGGGLSFLYQPEYLHNTAALPLSRHLPLQAEAFDNAPSRAFFENLLPEGSIRIQLARRLGISAENVFALLTELGGDCAGAVRLLPEGEHLETAGHYRPICVDELAAELDNLPNHPFLADEDGVRLSLAGAQNKLPVYFDGINFFIPAGDAPSSHILKTPIDHLENSVLNEAFFMNLAARAGLRVPSATVVEIGGRQFYLVERYDRKMAKDGILRLHQEDFCQALGVESAFKYEKEGGPGFADCFKLLRGWSDEPLVDVGDLLRWALFNFLIGNADAHGKNISFLYADGVVRLAPFYDLLSTAVYEPQVNNKFAMRMGGQKDPRYLAADNMEKFSAEIGVGLRVVKRELKALAKKVEDAALELAEEYRQRYADPAIIGRIDQVLRQRRSKVQGLF